MRYVGREFSDVVRGIELKCPVYKTVEAGQEQKYFTLSQNGLGENNLIFTSVVLGDLINRCEDHALEIYNAFTCGRARSTLASTVSEYFLRVSK